MQNNLIRDPNLETLRDRLHKMSDKELRRFGRGAVELCSETNHREEFVVQLREARAEWRRRYPSGAKSHGLWKLPRL